MKRFIIPFVCSLLFALPSYGQSEDPGFYFGIAGGLSIVPDSDLSANAFGTPVTGNLDFDTGFNIGAQLGYKFAMGLRPEFEYRYLRAGTGDFTVSALGTSTTVSTDDAANAHHFFANLWYDWDLKNRWMPYVGGGIGGVYLDVAGDTDTVFGGQAGVGIQFVASSNIVFDVGYRYVLTTDPSFSSGISGVSDIDAEYSSHNFLVGVRGHW